MFLVLGYVNADAEVANVWTFQIIRRANELGEDPLSLSNRFCQEYLNDMGDLQCLVPTHQPRVSEHLEQIKDMITQVSASVCFTFYFILKSRFLFSLILFFSPPAVFWSWKLKTLFKFDCSSLSSIVK